MKNLKILILCLFFWGSNLFAMQYSEISFYAEMSVNKAKVCKYENDNYIMYDAQVDGFSISAFYYKKGTLEGQYGVTERCDRFNFNFINKEEFSLWFHKLAYQYNLQQKDK